MSVEIEIVSPERQCEVFLVVNDYLTAILRGTHDEVEKAWKALIEMQEKEK